MKSIKVEFPDRIEYQNEQGELHRLDGPAYITNEYFSWYVNGKLHRLDGPAISQREDYLLGSYFIDGELFGINRFDKPYENEKFTKAAFDFRLKSIINL
jgi:hypothetical protein